MAVNYFSENGYLLGRWEGVPNTSVGLRRAQYRAADNPGKSAAIARQVIDVEHAVEVLGLVLQTPGEEPGSAHLDRRAGPVDPADGGRLVGVRRDDWTQDCWPNCAHTSPSVVVVP